MRSFTRVGKEMMHNIQKSKLLEENKPQELSLMVIFGSEFIEKFCLYLFVDNSEVAWISVGVNFY